MSALPEIQLAPFDYAALDLETRIKVEQRVTEIRSLTRKVAQDVFEMGAKFYEVRDLLRHNKDFSFQRWFETEGFKKQFVYNAIGVYQLFANRPNFGQLEADISALYLLVSPSVDPDKREALLLEADAGKALVYSHVKTELAKAPEKKWKAYDYCFYNGQRWKITEHNPSDDTFNLYLEIAKIPANHIKASELYESYDAWKAAYNAAHPSASPEVTEPPFVAPNPFNAAGVATPQNPPIAEPKPVLTVTDLIKLKFIEAGVIPIKIVAHQGDWKSTYSAGFNSDGTHEEADGEAKTYAALIETLGYKIINSGADIAPGSQTIGIGGENTPIVHFANAGYVTPATGETGSGQPSPSTPQKDADLREESPARSDDKLAIIPQAEMLEKYYRFTNTISDVGAKNPEGNRFEAPYFLGGYKIVVTIEPLVIEP